MVFNFVNPYILLLLPLTVGLTVFLYNRSNRLATWRRRTALILRISALCLLILGMSGFGLKKISNEVTTIFVADQSESIIKEKKAIEDLIAQAVNIKKANDKIGMVAFGSNALVEMLPIAKVNFNTIQSRPESSFTNIEQAMKLASSLIPANDRKRIVLLSDGRQNAGDAMKQASILKQQNIALDVFPITGVITGEVQIRDVSIPETLRVNEKFEVLIKLESTVKTTGTLKLYADRQLVAEREVGIQKGQNNYVFVDSARKEGMVTYSAVIDPDTDLSYKNNSLSVFSTIGDIAHVLVIQDGSSASELVKMLEGDIKISLKSPESAPVTVVDLQKYDAFIISDVSAERLDDRFLSSLETCIRHQGKGLLVTGGENSYAPGGYYKTVLEKVLPVNMDIKPEKENPNLGLVLVIDKSGSMGMGQYGVSKVELAKEAAIRSTEVLRSDDMIGVIGFDDAVSWVVKTRKLDNLKKIQDAIGTMRADGGTQILPPLEEAYKSLKDADTKLKHIILLTDGEAEKSGYEPLVEKIKAAGITLSTVAVGREADSQLLQTLAAGGNGRFYMTDEFSDIPKIFAKETFLAGKAYLNNRTFTPNLQNSSEIIKDIKAIPSLDGYVGTTAKSTAKVVFSSDQDDPVLATWQYGLGRTAAWTPDIKGMWSSNWLNWEQSTVFWKNLVSWVLQKGDTTGYSIQTGFESGKGRLELSLPPEERPSNEKVEVTLVSPSGKEQQMGLVPETPGTYSGDFEGEEEGVYIANIRLLEGSKIVKNIVSGVAIPYSPEYDIPEEGVPVFLERLAKEGGGRIIEKASDIMEGKLPPIVGVTDLTQLLLTAVIILFFLDIAVRRVNIPADKLKLVTEKAVNSLERTVNKGTRTAANIMNLKIHPGRQKREGLPDNNTANVKNIDKELNAATNSNTAAKHLPENAKHQKAPEATKEQRNAHISSLLEKKRKREGKL